MGLFIKIFFQILILIIILIYYFYPINSYCPFSDEVETYKIGDGESLKVGVISDVHLPYSKKSSKIFKDFIENFENSLKILKENKIEVLIVAGDIGEKGSEFAYKLFLKTFNKIFDKKQPILNIIMGNHDYFGPYYNNIYHQKIFEKVFNQKPFTHKIINNFHFINWGNENNDMNHKSNLNSTWFKNHLRIALDQKSKKNPIFVTTHVNPYKTVFGSETWGNSMLKELFDGYEEIINICGHSHFSMMDERSIFQNNFTVVQTQTVSRIECELNKANGLYPEFFIKEIDSNKNPKYNSMGYIVNINKTNVQFQRISFSFNKIYDKFWNVKIPLKKENFLYKNEIRIKNDKKPDFKGDNKIFYTIKKNYKKHAEVVIKFQQAFHKENVYEYKIMIFNYDKDLIKEFYYLSDFYLLPENREEFISFKLKYDFFNDLKYYIKIYAIDSWGKISENYLIQDLNVTEIIDSYNL